MERHRLELDETRVHADINNERRDQVATYVIVILCIAAAVWLAVTDSRATEGAIVLTGIVACLLVRRRCGADTQRGIERGP